MKQNVTVGEKFSLSSADTCGNEPFGKNKTNQTSNKEMNRKQRALSVPIKAGGWK